MNRFYVVENLKSYFGTLFLDSYHLPCLDDIVKDIDKMKENSKQHEYLHSLNVLSEFLAKVESKYDSLLLCSLTEKIGFFSSRIHDYDTIPYFPLNYENSVLIFFHKFLDSNLTPVNDDEIDKILQWSFFIVLFEEANLIRVKAALNLLMSVKQHFNPYKKFCVNEVK